jgi:hypothetical protein
MTRTGPLAVGLLLLFLVTGAQAEFSAFDADVRQLIAHPSYDTAWRELSGADFAGFMAFCRHAIPPSGIVVSIVAQPTYGYYRGSFELYPRTVWPIVSPQGPHAFDRPHVTAPLLSAVLRRTHARYLLVWHVNLPSPVVAHRWVATFAPGEYVMALA